MTVESLSQKIKTRALQLGFSKVGITAAQELTEEGMRLTEWLNREYHGTMDWMERNRDRRIDPKKILPGARSVVSVAMNYFTPHQHRDDPETARISRYAWGDDYHEVLTRRLQQLVAFIGAEIPDANAKLYVDTGPVLEKAVAQRAGIGWMGKHTNLITKEFGSWVFLGEIILDQELEPDSPMADFCGSCRACLDACPTGALTQEYVLDATRCISYLTIEHKGPIPDELAGKFHNWVYGCDICQDVCPWNRFETPSEETAFQPRSVNRNPSLRELSGMDQESFTRMYRKSPMKRTKWTGMMRNVRAVMSSDGSTGERPGRTRAGEKNRNRKAQ